MRVQKVGYIGYKLYTIGWRNSQRNHLSWLQHLLLSSLLYYRKGFEQGSEWIKNYRFEGNRH